MIESLLVSQSLLWALVLLLGVAVLVLARQVGVLHERIQPVGALALSTGPVVGEPAPLVAAASLAGDVAHIGGADAEGRSRLLFFVSPSCPVCRTLLPVVRSVAEREAATLLVASDGSEHDHRRYAAAQGVAANRYFVSQELGQRYGVAKLPYAVLIDGDGRVAAQGLVNQREHVESLFEARALGAGTLQQYLEEAAPLGASPGVSA